MWNKASFAIIQLFHSNQGTNTNNFVHLSNLYFEQTVGLFTPSFSFSVIYQNNNPLHFSSLYTTVTTDDMLWMSQQSEFKINWSQWTSNLREWCYSWFHIVKEDSTSKR